MKKNINKLIAIGIGISIVSGNIVPALAATNDISKQDQLATLSENKFKVLTLENAIELGVANNKHISLISQQIKLYNDKIDILEAKKDIPGQLVSDSDKDLLETQVKQQKQKRDFYKDKITTEITEKYNNIVVDEKKLAVLNKNLQIKSKEIEDAKLKNKLGLTTKIDTKSAELELQTLKDSISLAEKNLQSNISYFSALLNTDLSNYELSSELVYEPIKIEGSIDDYIDEQVNTYFRYSEELLDVQKDILDDMKNKGVDKKPSKPDISTKPSKPEDSEYQNTDDVSSYLKYTIALEKYNEEINGYIAKLGYYQSYLETKYSYNSRKVQLDEGKRDLKKTLVDNYNTLVDLQNTISVLVEQINVMNTRLENAKLQYDLGLMTKSQYNSMISTAEDLENSLRSCIYNYDKLKDYVEKPWVFLVS